MASTIAVPNETEASTICLVDGARLKYELKVLQQPERARACGAGAKSSADRRPVDPPPVVELKILTTDSDEDVTFRHHANFFLYTTLELARPIMPGRSAATASPSPVLTGMPVAGMAYLDRPHPAGYFIFPDLSVRHEGVYRLSFHLFEQFKGRDGEADPSLATSDAVGGRHLQGLDVTQSKNVQYRLEVKSEPFTVFSAKKFPGLAESTNLSRLVAEQGCRVRIRRDVRMRRRETKPAKEHDDLDQDAAPYGRADGYCTPDSYAPHVPRGRSTSAASVDPMPYPHQERRSSLHEAGYYGQPTYQQPPMAPILQPATGNYNTHLTFGNAPTSAQCQPSSMPVNGSAAAQSAVPYSPSPSGYPNPPTLAHARQMSNGSEYGYQTQAYPQPQYATQGYPDTVEYKQPTPVRRPIMPHSAGNSHEAPIYPAVDSRLAAGNQAYYVQSPVSVDPRSSTPTGVQHLPPLKALHPASDAKLEASVGSCASGEAGASVPQSTFDSDSGYSSLIGSHHGGVPGPAANNFSRPGKRSYAKVFDTNHLSQPVHGGARPQATGQDVPQVECDEGLTDEVDLASLKMLSYRRADGSRQHKKIPSPIC